MIKSVISRSRRTCPISAVDRSCDPQTLVEIMRVGVREFVSMPLDLIRLGEAIGRVAVVLERRPLAFHSTDEVFSFLPAKAGDGTSTVAVNVSSAITRRAGGRTLIADFDLNVGMVSFLLKVTNAHSVLDAIRFADHLDDAVWGNLVAKRDNLDVLGSGRLDPGAMLYSAQAENVLLFARRAYRAICLDLSGNMEAYSMELIRQSKEVFLIKLLRDAGLGDRISVLLNRTERRNAFSMKDVEELLGVRVRFAFMNDPKRVSRALEGGKCVDAKIDLGRQFTAFAELLAGSVIEAAIPAARKRRYIEYFAIVSSSYQTDGEKPE